MKTRESGREAEVIPLVAISTNSKQNRGPGDRLGLDYAATDLVSSLNTNQDVAFLWFL